MELIFKAIDKRLATKTVVAHHYLHRKCPISYAFGAFLKDELAGVLTVGCPASWSLRTGVVGISYKDYKTNPDNRAVDVYELNRLWMADDLPTNSESKFIGWCLRSLRKLKPSMIVVSYADTAVGHLGTIYQASNWIYTGTSIPFKDIHPIGYGDYREVPLSVRGEKVGNKRAWALDPAIPHRERTRKHRYVWFANSADRMLLAWPVAPYPKAEIECSTPPPPVQSIPCAECSGQEHIGGDCPKRDDASKVG